MARSVMVAGKVLQATTKTKKAFSRQGSVVCMSAYPAGTGDFPVFYNTLHISVLGTQYYHPSRPSHAHLSHGTPVAAPHFDRCWHLSKFSGDFFRVHHARLRICWRVSVRDGGASDDGGRYDFGSS